MLEQQRQRHASVVKNCIHHRASSGAVGEHFAGSPVVVEANRHSEAHAIVFERASVGATAVGEPPAVHRVPPCVSIAQSRMARASASLSSVGVKPRVRTAAITAALSALPLPVTWRLIVPTGTPW